MNTYGLYDMSDAECCVCIGSVKGLSRYTGTVPSEIYNCIYRGFLILVFSPAIIGTWYHAEKQEYKRRKAMMK